MNVELLQRVKQHILEEPNRLAMKSEIQQRHFMDALDGYGFKPEAIILHPPCGTAACIAGWACILGQSELKPSELAFSGTVRTLAGELLDINGIQLDRLYCTNRWPARFYEAFKTTDLQKRAEVAAARIDHFIETGE